MKVLYHANCNDGAAAALAIWLKRGDGDTDYIPVQYGQDPPLGLQGEYVAIVDFSYSRDVLVNIAKTAEHVLVLDHHKTAEHELEGLSGDNLEVYFNMDRAGCVMTWEYFHPGVEVPTLFKLVEDRDLWKLQYGDTTHHVSKSLQVYDDWRKWTPFVDVVEELEQQGAFLCQFLERKTKHVVRNPPSRWQITGDLVPVYNLPGFMISDTLGAALKEYPEVPYAVAYFDLYNDRRRVYSLRSTKYGADVSVIAKAYGGGGHRCAAGFSVSLPS